MKLPPARTAAFLRDPGPVRVVLLHGDDEGLVRARADALTRAVLGAADDPFRLAALGPEEADRLPEEATAISMLGGRRVVRLRGPGESAAPKLEAILAGPGDSLVILESGALTKRSKLLTLLEAAPSAAVLRCDPAEAQNLRATIAAGLEAGGVRCDRDALDWLAEHLGGDHLATRGEIEKLLLYAGPEKHLDLDAVRVCIGDAAATSLDETAFCATLGDVAGADRAIERTLAEGTSAIGVLRVLLGHMVKLQTAREAAETGSGPEAAVAALRPPVFFKRRDDMIRSVERWPLPRATAAVAELRRAELACKQTGAPAELITRRLVLTLARQAEGRRR